MNVNKLEMVLNRAEISETIKAQVRRDIEYYSIYSISLIEILSKHKISPALILNKNLTDEQRKEVANGLISGVNVEIYYDEKLSPSQMKEARLMLARQERESKVIDFLTR